MTKMTGKVALIMGGASGIGVAIAERLATEGAQVFLTGRRQAEVEAAALRVGHNARGIVANASDLTDIERVIATVKAEQGRIDALVLNAGLSEAADLLSSTPELFDRHFTVNTRGPLLTMKVAAPHMPAGSVALLVGSVASVKAVSHYGTYAATKAALRSYARTWAAELAPRGIRVNVLSPGPTDTAMMENVSKEIHAAILSQVPMGRLARPEEVAAAALFLLSDESSFVTGADLYVDGGMGQV
jgi:NAD(P)-dependent dehydrogenase (short-subunit alcohol dehydrogenase family)